MSKRDTRDRATRQHFKPMLGKKIFITFEKILFQTNDLCVKNKTEVFESYNVKWNKYWQCVDFISSNPINKHKS